MKISFDIQGLPPKKDGANSMWNKRAELPRIRDLRAAAAYAMNGQPARTSPLCLRLHVYAHENAGDLDNFITGICDSLMAAHVNTPIDASLWIELPEAAQPNKAIAFHDDACITKIEAERMEPDANGPRYHIELEWL
jgi:hypothetical protein